LPRNPIQTWIGFTLLAVVMQSLRTAGQKQLAANLTAQSTTLVRYLFGLPYGLAAGLGFALYGVLVDSLLSVVDRFV
jgi:drug/metabolite transporter (DMT)-like permease